jgi:hypothetical protein
MRRTLTEGLREYQAQPTRAPELLARAASFSWAQAATDYLAVYDHLLRP